jgi:hypothetical protein
MVHFHFPVASRLPDTILVKDDSRSSAADSKLCVVCALLFSLSRHNLECLVFVFLERLQQVSFHCDVLFCPARSISLKRHVAQKADINVHCVLITPSCVGRVLGYL